MAKITINGITIDPLTQQPALMAANLLREDASSSNYILIQTTQPLDKVQKTELAGKGVEVLEYVPEDTYICHFLPSDLTSIRSLPYVAWANMYMPAFKIAPSLHAPRVADSRRVILDAVAGPQASLSTTPHMVDVVFHDDVEPDTLRDTLATAAHLNRSDLNFSAHKARLTVQARYLPNLAQIDQVRAVEEVTAKKLANNVAREILRVSGGGTVFEGEGQIIAVADTGFDKGSVADVHPAFAGRVVKLYAMGRPGEANDPEGHGTHVAGSVLGDGASAALGIDIRGTAPKAKLVLQSVLDSNGGLGGLPNDLTHLFTPPYQDDGAYIHTNSWGSTLGDGRYDQNAGEIDDFVWNHRDCVICFAAGNEGKDPQGRGRDDANSITAPGTAKNCITVGACENDRPDFDLTYGQGWHADFPAEPMFSDKVADNPNGMAGFSSRGPTQNNRIKPDVVAPGTYVLSTLSRDVGDPDPGWGGSGDPLYFYDGGTSMATPLVAGCVAVVREYLQKKRGIPRPSAALLKALLINACLPIAGQYVPSETGPLPSNADGFGRVDVGAALDASVVLQDEATALDTGESQQIALTVPAQSSLLKVTLVWTDPKGEALQNDLDLIVHASTGEERHGNVGDSSSAFDRLNNVEQVIWAQPPAGAVSVIVRANRVTLHPQSYALAIRVR